MDTLLFLAHRLPYPPNKGDKVRSYHLLRHLAQSNRVVLGSFIDDPLDWRHVEKLKSLCAEVHVEPIVPWLRRIRSAGAVLTGEAMALPYFRSREMHEWVKDVVRRERIERAFVFSSPMAQYVLDLPRVRSIVDFVDLDSAKWDDYAQRRVWPVSALYRRESRRLLAFEKAVAARVEASVFVTREEAGLLTAAAPECANRVVAIENGVDSEYFSPTHNFNSPFSPGEHPIVFTGTMDYWPNVDAVIWFAREVLPRIRQHDACARFHIVGMKPQRAVRALRERCRHRHRPCGRRASLPPPRARSGRAAPGGARHPEQGARGDGDGPTHHRHFRRRRGAERAGWRRVGGCRRLGGVCGEGARPDGSGCWRWHGPARPRPHPCRLRVDVEIRTDR